jgi:hypothetical protein
LIAAARHEAPKVHLENRDINALLKSIHRVAENKTPAAARATAGIGICRMIVRGFTSRGRCGP